jgi:uncharacterized protein YbjQ (UPF0145 family)
MLTTTTHTIEGKQIKKYLGIVSAESIFGTNILRDFAASIRDLVGGRSQAYETIVSKAKCTALQEMEQEASTLGANAIVGASFEINTIGEHNSMVLVSWRGTAVWVE